MCESYINPTDTSELIKPINDILKNYKKVVPADKIQPLPLYTKGKGKVSKLSPDIQKYLLPIHTTNFEVIKSLIVQAPVRHLPACTGCFYLECDSSAKHVGSVLYQIQNGTKHVIAFYSAMMPDAACPYSSSEHELCGLKKSLLHFQYLLKYSIFTVPMDHNALKRIYCSCKPMQTIHIQTFLEEISDFSFDFQHLSCKHMDTSLLNNDSYMTQLDAICKFNYKTGQDICTSHSFPITRSQAKLQKIAIPSIFKPSTDRPSTTLKASIL